MKLCSYDRDIVCLPFCYSSKHGKYAIPRSETRATLASSGLIGKVRLSSDMSQDQILTEIRSVFSAEMNENQNFPISFLQRSGQGSNSLTVPSISNSYQWSAKEVVRMAGQGCIYIKAEARLNCEMVGGINWSHIYSLLVIFFQTYYNYTTATDGRWRFTGHKRTNERNLQL